MCRECYAYPCRQSCPNEAEVPAILACDTSGCPGIHEGEEYTEIDELTFCRACFEELTHRELADMLLGGFSTARRGEL